MTADAIAAELEISRRSVYRDIADLIGRRVPILGEAGVGYVLAGEYDMPALMLTSDEVEAAMLGAQWVAQRGDPVLAHAARSLIDKIASSIPERLRPFITEPTIGSPPNTRMRRDGLDIARTRLWIRSGRKLRIQYRDESDVTSERVIWPLIVGYAETVRMLAAWCELRTDFRHFRCDRIIGAEFLDDEHGAPLADLQARWKERLQGERGVFVR